MSSKKQTRRDNDNDTKLDGHIPPLESRHKTPQSPSFFEPTAVDAGAGRIAMAARVFDTKSLPFVFGNYTLLEVIGEGGAGIVFRAKANSGQVVPPAFDEVAVKLIRPEILASPKAAKRFEKESRLHSEIDSPFVTRHLEFGCEQGIHFLVSEFVAGVGLDQIIRELGTLPTNQSLRVVADILNALCALHNNGVVHRDVKPGNLIVKLRSSGKAPNGLSFEDYEIGKLTDFGLARHIEQSESLAMTRQQALLGTPLYMAPEQYSESRTVDARADIYAVGVTLYQMLAGQTPFISDEAIKLAEMHRIERPRPLTLICDEISEAVNNIVMKALEKEPSLRYQDAAEMLTDVERALAGEPIGLRLYPETPDANHPKVRSYTFEWDLDASTKQLWPLVSDTDRFNQAIGLPAPKFSYDHTGPDRMVFAEANFNGVKARWREHPFQWIVEREMSILREFTSGPFEWVTSTVETHRLTDNRTRLIHRFKVKPRGFLGMLMTPIQFGFLTRRSLNRVYTNLVRIINEATCRYACDVSFSKPKSLTAAQQQQLNDRSEKLAQCIADPKLSVEFSNYLGAVADGFAARIHPFLLAKKLNCSLDESLQICMHGVQVGLLNMSWDVICPVCKISAENLPSLAGISGHSRCEVCNLDFEVDFSKSVEVIFSVHPEVRSIEVKTYCIGGPFHAPHVLAQNRLLPSQFIDVGAVLTSGRYEITGPQITYPQEIKVHENAIGSRAEFVIPNGSKSSIQDLRPGMACIQLKNKSEREIVVRLEQSSDREDSLTAAMASRHPLFQKLFPSEVLGPTNLVDLSNVYLLAIKYPDVDLLIDQIGELQVREGWNQMQEHLQSQLLECEIVECTHESLLVSLPSINCTLDALNGVFLAKGASQISIADCSIAINFGEVMVGTHSNQPNVFGKTVRETKKMLSKIKAGALVMPQHVHELIVENATPFRASFLDGFKSSKEDLTTGLFYLRRDTSSNK